MNMTIEALCDYNPLIFDIITDYKSIRYKGDGRSEAIAKLYSMYENELGDEDEAPVVKIAIALALCQKKELTPDVRDTAIQAIDEMVRSGIWEEEGSAALIKARKYLSDEKKLGDEASYKRRLYVPDWKIGDTFIHQMNGHRAVNTGFSGWYIIMRKVGEYVSRDERTNQLVYCSICPPDKLPKNASELNALGVVRMMKHGKKYDYLSQLEFTSKRDEAKYDLTRIGCFPEISIPADATEENPLATYPLSRFYSEEKGCVSYEDTVFRQYRELGTSTGDGSVR